MDQVTFDTEINKDRYRLCDTRNQCLEELNDLSADGQTYLGTVHRVRHEFILNNAAILRRGLDGRAFHAFTLHRSGDIISGIASNCDFAIYSPAMQSFVKDDTILMVATAFTGLEIRLYLDDPLPETFFVEYDEYYLPNQTRDMFVKSRAVTENHLYSGGMLADLNCTSLVLREPHPFTGGENMTPIALCE